MTAPTRRGGRVAAVRYVGGVHEDCATDAGLRARCGCEPPTKITVSWQPGHQDWGVGMYRVRVAEVGRKSGDVENVHVFDAHSSVGYTPEELGIERGEFTPPEAYCTAPEAYDIVAEKVVRDLHARYPNRAAYSCLARALDEGGLRRRP